MKKFRLAPLLAILFVWLACQSDARPPSELGELVGYKACVHLMVRLVEVLAGACDLYLGKPGLEINPLSGGARLLLEPSTGGKPPPEALKPDKLMGALGPSALLQNLAELRSEPELEAIWSMEAEVLATTKPMSRAEPARAKELENGMKTSGCWQELVGWLKVQLSQLRADLLAIKSSGGSGQPLAGTLKRFAEFNAYLTEACDTAPELPSGPDSLEFILQVVQVMADIHAEVQRKAGGHDKNLEHANGADKSEKKKKNKDDKKKKKKMSEQLDEAAAGSGELAPERLAAEALKMHFSYLTQLISSYNLLFNVMDRDLMN